LQSVVVALDLLLAEAEVLLLDLLVAAAILVAGGCCQRGGEAKI